MQRRKARRTVRVVASTVPGMLGVIGSRVSRALDCPWLYRLSQVVLAPGAQSGITQAIGNVLRQVPPAGLVLDVGCGPSSWLFRLGLDPLGVDLSFRYMKEYARAGHRTVVGSADALPFVSHSFDSVWNIGLLHHLPDELAVLAVSEIVRVCRPGGYVVMMDAVLPLSPWRRPLAYLLRRLDRGRFVRHQGDLISLLPKECAFKTERITYSFNGLELLVCWSRIGSDALGARLCGIGA